MKFSHICRKISAIALSAALLISVTGCTANTSGDGTTQSNSSAETSEDPVSVDFFAMDTYMTLTAYGENAADAVAAAEEEVHRLDDLLSTGNEDSEIAKLNASGGETVTLSDDAAILVEEALALYEDTNGAFNIAVYPLMEAWGFTTQEFRVPEISEITELLSYTDVSSISYNNETKEITLPANVQIDLGGIAKGYTSARVLEIMKEYGVSHALVNLGGNVQVLGAKTDGTKWRIAVQDPEDSSGVLGVLSVQDKAVITSGGYERYFEEGGITYHHILDPSNGYPADSGVVSATIISSNGMLADGLSTSLFIMGEEKAADFWRAHADEFDYVLVTEDNTMYVTEGIADSFSTEGTVVIVEED